MKTVGSNRTGSGAITAEVFRRLAQSAVLQPTDKTEIRRADPCSEPTNY